MLETGQPVSPPFHVLSLLMIVDGLELWVPSPSSMLDVFKFPIMVPNWNIPNS